APFRPAPSRRTAGGDPLERGRPAILAADACEAAGLAVPRFDATLRERLTAALPAIAGTTNPVDLGAGAGAGGFTAAGEAILDSGAADALLVIHTPTSGGDAH